MVGLAFMSHKDEKNPHIYFCRKITILCASVFLSLGWQIFAELPESKLLAQTVPANTDLEAASFYQQGVMRYNRKDLEGAESALRQALRRDPNFAAARNYLGNILLQTNRLESAVQEYSEAIRINPNLAEAYYNLGLALQKQGQNEAAITAYRQALIVAPTMASSHYNLGLVLYEQGRLDEAIAAYQQAVNFDSENSNAYFNLAIAQQNAGNLEDAIAAYKRVLEIDPNNIQAYNNMGSLQAIQGRTQNAVAIYKQAINNDPNNPQAYYNLGVTWYNQGEIKKAKSAFKRAGDRFRSQGDFQQVEIIEQLMQQIAAEKEKPVAPDTGENPPVDENSNPEVFPSEDSVIEGDTNLSQPEVEPVASPQENNSTSEGDVNFSQPEQVVPAEADENISSVEEDSLLPKGNADLGDVDLGNVNSYEPVIPTQNDAIVPSFEEGSSPEGDVPEDNMN